MTTVSRYGVEDGKSLGMSPFAKHRFIEKVLWGLKIPEVLATCFIAGGTILFLFGAIPVSVPLYFIAIRAILIVLRVLIVVQKRGLEKKYNLLKITYVPTIIKKGTQKVEFVTKYK